MYVPKGIYISFFCSGKRAVGDAGPYDITGSLVRGRRGGVSPPAFRSKNILFTGDRKGRPYGF